MAYDLSLTEEQEALIQTARDFTRKEITPVAAHYDEHDEFPRAILRKAFETGLMNIEVPDAYGGLGGSCLDHCLIQEEVAYGCLGFNTSLAANMLGAMPVLVAGTDDQQREWLPRLTEGGEFAAYCCSEPDAGSDVAGLSTRVRKDGGDYLITGQKRWITNAGVAGWYTVLATFDRGLKHKGIAAFVVDAKTPGVKVGRKENKMGQRASDTCDVLFEDVRIPARNLLGTEDGGFKVAMKTFDRSRPWIAAGAAGVIRRALDESRAYALERKTFGVPIAQHQAIQFILAEMAIAYETTRLLTHKAAWLVDKGDLSSIVSSYAKAYGADAAMRVTTDAVQVFGGYGYTKEYPVEKLMRDAKLLQIYEGTSQIQRMVIAKNLLGRGMIPSPIGSIVGAVIGSVRGTLIGDAPIAAPLSGRPCWYYKIVVEAPEGMDWKRLAYEARGQSFEIDDGTGIALVDPEGAQVEVDYDQRYEVAPGGRVPQPVAELMRRFRLPDAPVVLREGVLAVGEVVAVHGRLVPESDPDPTRGRTRVRVVGPGRERVFVSERSVDGWAVVVTSA